MIARIKNNKQRGFTIIEVMIVLAIAGVIMAIVFGAIPQAQRSTRNTKAKSVVNSMKVALESYSTNNNGQYPWQASSGAWTAGITYTSSDTKLFTRYLANTDIKNPKSGNDMSIIVKASGNTTPTANSDTVDLTIRARCDGDAVTTTGATGDRQYTLSFALEGGATYCVDNG